MSCPCTTDTKCYLCTFRKGMMVGMICLSNSACRCFGVTFHDASGELDGIAGSVVAIGGGNALLTVASDEEGKGSYI